MLQFNVGAPSVSLLNRKGNRSERGRGDNKKIKLASDGELPERR